MAGVTDATSWTHLIPGFIVSGLGGGMVNPPLASTAIGVVSPQRAGMASGVNTTFRQMGIAVRHRAPWHSVHLGDSAQLATTRVATAAHRGGGPARPGQCADRRLAAEPPQ
jgi:hypothetical protein